MNSNERANEEQHQCCGGPASNLLPVEQGRQQILETVTALPQTQQLDLRHALGRVLAEPVVSPINVPAYNNSAMDGYAVRSADIQSDGDTRLEVVGSVLAGHPFSGELQPGQCVKIMTGAQVPDALDTVVIKELCRCEKSSQQEFVIFPAGAKPGQNRRLAGEDLAVGSPAIGAGTRLGAAELGMIASLGQAEVCVTRKPRVAYFSTGDEIRSLGQPLEAGQIYDSNRYTVTAMLAGMGIEVIDLGVIADRPDAIEAAFKQASEQADVVLSSGGVSLGEADFVKDCLDRLGQVGFWRLAMKPGRPLAFGHVGEALFFGLPGNPVAVMVSFLQFVKPALRKLGGENHWLPSEAQIRCTEPIRKRPGRTEYVRGIISHGADGQPEVRSSGHQGSGILTSMSQANCLIVLSDQQSPVAAGDWVRVQPFDGLL
ncbi:bifunctional molybdopterin-guanine dinucleotide biosynthesis adaptor protein MobB/molybdopterin molybdotransferase MoeA [Motiliproteus coralliicola]|uniref:molybdopterin molybdotransferase MoeA n=1 Tax=Motiliproteus coralliicola TaxID=2283196 RepID=UPI001402DAF8|nr:bifunctional molybdopterin-guanine dinucleotide biosynthesis adaptor protein MobB/molybdopterin molybdotransferase MoeA [Motiliproteus coralliicola]